MWSFLVNSSVFSFLTDIEKRGRIFLESPICRQMVAMFVAKVRGPETAAACSTLYLENLPNYKTSKAGKGHYIFSNICMYESSFNTKKVVADFDAGKDLFLFHIKMKMHVDSSGMRYAILEG
ncbi:hypothetical protein AVEN_94577-1 [Araneus ventricosus]|uniref:Uncharacterized protein n=1 Tax=Araneus ventricosus TaxID=182803 RepID=A0A4Y2ISF8_ARAVE|nr:hypothetical protein AVEN_94577-1 [Araneus ventricosus]